jgi:hypothetical protein
MVMNVKSRTEPFLAINKFCFGVNKLDVMMNRDCQAGQFSLIDIRDKYSQNTDILYIIKGGEPVYFLLLDIFPKHKNVYIHDVCVNKLHRGKGIFKRIE